MTTNATKRIAVYVCFATMYLKSKQNICLLSHIFKICVCYIQIYIYIQQTTTTNTAKQKQANIYQKATANNKNKERKKQYKTRLK